VIVIDTDDQNQSDMWVMQQTLALLGARGTTFQNSYVSYPLCCPSRATHLTGQYARPRQLEHTRGLAVRQAKYRTAMLRKYLNGYGASTTRKQEGLARGGGCLGAARAAKQALSWGCAGEILLANLVGR